MKISSRACRVESRAVEPVFQRLWRLATSLAVGVNCAPLLLLLLGLPGPGE